MWRLILQTRTFGKHSIFVHQHFLPCSDESKYSLCSFWAYLWRKKYFTLENWKQRPSSNKVHTTTDQIKLTVTSRLQPNLLGFYRETSLCGCSLRTVCYCILTTYGIELAFLLISMWYAREVTGSLHEEGVWRRCYFYDKSMSSMSLSWSNHVSPWPRNPGVLWHLLPTIFFQIVNRPRSKKQKSDQRTNHKQS